LLGDFSNDKSKPGFFQFESVNLRPGALEGLKLLCTHFQVVVFSRESKEDSWVNENGGQTANFNDQNKQVKRFVKAFPDIRIDGLYSSLISVQAQQIWEDY